MARKTKKETATDYREMELVELERALDKAQQDLFKVRFRAATASLKNVMQVRTLRREAARLNTFINQKRRELV